MKTIEKAKLYDEAIERAKSLLSGNQLSNAWIYKLLPELKESDDERIKYEIKVVLANTDLSQFALEYTFADMLAWLEKQGEQNPQGKSALEAVKEEKVDNQNCVKPVSKVEPKFNVSDWVFIEEAKGYKNGPFQIKAVDSFGYSFDEYHTIPFMYKDLLSKWTIQDAKDGDVLVHNNCTFIFMGIKDGIVQALEEDLLDGTNPVPFGKPDEDDDYHPATKEQRDTLLKAMTDAGYTFDFEKKELRKIEQKLTWSEERIDEINRKIFPNHYGGAKVLDTYNPVWGEEDEKKNEDEAIRSNPIPELPSSAFRLGFKLGWFKALRPQNTWKPSDEQMKALDIAIRCGIQLGSWEERALKSLKEQLKKLTE